MYPFLFLIVLLSALQRLQCDWVTSSTPTEDHSIMFSSKKYGFACPSVQCLSTFPKNMNTYVHFMVGTNHISSFPLAVAKLCDLMQHCLDRKAYKITLHISSTSIAPNSFINLFQSLDVPFQIWNGNFTSTNKMMHYLNTYKWAKDGNNYFYHTDLDEIPDARLLAKAIEELQTGKCDAIRAVWRERATLDGSLLKLTLDALGALQVESSNPGQNQYSTAARGLYRMFPLRCNISANFLRHALFTTRKIIIYRSNLRLTSGQHDVWCDKPVKNSDPSYPWKHKAACMKHITSTRERYDKSVPPVDIYRLLPTLDKRPIICPTIVILDHFKFIGGAEEYLLQRAKDYASRGLHWWTQSQQLVEYVQKNKNKVCVSCEENYCELVQLF
jgi:hypothetical protein